MKEAHVMLTTNCNIKCEYCFYHQREERRMKEVITPETFEVLIEKLKALDCEEILFTGGEPLLNKNIVQFAEIAKAAGMSASVTTNAKLLNPALIAKLIEAGISAFHLSVDSLDAEIHWHLRKGSEVGHIIEMAQEIRKYVGVGVSFSTVITSFNYKELSSLLLYSAQKQINLVLQPVILSDDHIASSNLGDFDIEGAEWDGFKRVVSIWAKNMNVKDYGQMLIEYLENKSIQCEKCSHGRNMVVVRPNGDLAPCFFMDSEQPFANINTDDLQYIRDRYDHIYEELIATGSCLSNDCVSMQFRRPGVTTYGKDNYAQNS